MITIEQFEKHKTSKSTRRTINEFGVTIYFALINGDKKFRISGYTTGFNKPEYICSVSTIDECNGVYQEICEKLTFVSKFQKDIDLKQFFIELKNEYSPHQKRFNGISDDGIISVWVKKEGEMWIPKIKDYGKGTEEYREGFLSSVLPTEKEAEDICKNCLNEYNLYGHYKRLTNRKKFILEHESVDIAPEIGNEYYIYDNGIKTEITQKQIEKIKIMIENGVI